MSILGVPCDNRVLALLRGVTVHGYLGGLRRIIEVVFVREWSFVQCQLPESRWSKSEVVHDKEIGVHTS